MSCTVSPVEKSFQEIGMGEMFQSLGDPDEMPQTPWGNSPNVWGQFESFGRANIM